MSGIQIQPFFCVLVCLSYVVFVLWAWHSGIMNDLTQFDTYAISDELQIEKISLAQGPSKIKAVWRPGGGGKVGGGGGAGGLLVCLHECRKISKILLLVAQRQDEIRK